jgi:hypothetical protein
MNLNRFSSRVRALSSLALLSAATAGCTSEVSDEFQPEYDLATATEAVQSVYTLWSALVSNALSTLPMAKATAAIRMTNNSNGAIHATCGATFVSRNYAVTAAHCVSAIIFQTGLLTLEEINVTQLDSNEVSAYSTVVGTWPNWQPAGRLTTGYSIRNSLCTVQRRCSNFWGTRQACPIAEDADIALIHCPNRLNTDRALTTAEIAPFPVDIDDQATLTVNTWWFHEVYNLPVEDDGTERWQHYGRYISGQPNNNFHYRPHQLVPLLSYWFPDGTKYKTVPFNGATLNSMDTPVCHGTSGSGVFAGDSNVLLGPAISAGNHSQIGNRLCDRFNALQPGGDNTRYIRGAITAAFVTGSPEVLANR